MAKKHINAGNANIPDYKTLKEIVVIGAQKGQDKRQFVFLDKDKNECDIHFYKNNYPALKDAEMKLCFLYPYRLKGCKNGL